MDSRAFEALGPDLILSSVEAAGLAPNGRFMQLNSLENRVYALDLESGERVIAKFYRPDRWTRAQILEEHAFAAELAAQGVEAMAPLLLAGGMTLLERGGFAYAVWAQAPGRSLDEPSAKEAAMMGRALARLHEIGSARPFAHRLSLDAETYARRPLAFLLEGGLIPKDLEARYAAAGSSVAEALEACLPAMPSIRIHGDFHWGNVLSSGAGLSILDFDDAVNGPPVQDIWMMAPALDSAGLALRDAFLAAYRELRPFPDTWLPAIGPLRAARYLRHAAWIAERRDDASFLRAFPDFGSDEWWERETTDLENAVRNDFPAAMAAKAAYDPEYDGVDKLTDKDYFFDM